jgi:hypothetical protein
MAIVFFPERLADERKIHRDLHEARNRTVLVRSFLDKAYHAIREEVWNLHRDVRDRIPPFNSVFDLSERHATCETRRIEISSALLCIAYLAQYIGYVQPDKEQIENV